MCLNIHIPIHEGFNDTCIIAIQRGLRQRWFDMPLLSHHYPQSIPLREAEKRRIKEPAGLKVFHIFARVPVLDAARNVVVRVVTEMYSADIRNDVVQARKRARRSLCLFLSLSARLT